MKKLLLVVTLLLSGCAMFEPKTIVETKTVDKLVYVTTPLPLPARPTLPTWKGSDMSCLSEEMKEKVRTRDLYRKQYAEMLEAIIKSTQK